MSDHKAFTNCPNRREEHKVKREVCPITGRHSPAPVREERGHGPQQLQRGGVVTVDAHGLEL